MRSNRSQAFLAAEAIERYLADAEWQIGAIAEGLSDLEAGRTVSHAKVSKWLRSCSEMPDGTARR